MTDGNLPKVVNDRDSELDRGLAEAERKRGEEKNHLAESLPRLAEELGL